MSTSPRSILDRLNPASLTKEHHDAVRPQPVPELDALIEEITVDAYDADEQLQGSENAYDADEQLQGSENAFAEDANFSCPANVIGEELQVMHIGRANNRRELIATCRHNNRHYDIALLDIDLNAEPEPSRLIAAYRRWAVT